MQRYLIGLILALLYSNVICLFNTTSSSKFNITDIERPKKLVMDGSGAKFIVWNSMSIYSIYSTSGNKLCSGNFSASIMRIIWPAGYYPLILLYPGKTLVRLDDQYCTNAKTYNLTSVFGEVSFTMRGSLQIAVLSSLAVLQEYNLNTSTASRTYVPNTLVFRFLRTMYSADGLKLYAM